MKIGLDVAQTAAERAGCAWYADALARAMVDVGRPEGHEFVLYHQFGDWINGEPGHGTYLTGSDVEMPMRRLLPVPARSLWRQIEAGEAPLPGEPDVVIASSFHAPRVAPAKLIYVVHDMVFWTHPDFATDSTRMVCQRELGQAIAHASAFVFVSETTRKDFESFFPGWLESSGRLFRVAGGASRWETVTQPAIRSTRAPWLMVGSIEPRKNHGCALEAYEQYAARAENPRPLHIVGGRGWHSEKIHQKMAALRQQGLEVIYRGYVADRDLRAAYRDAFALLQPSWHEGFGLPVLESFSQGLPVIASDAGSLPEVSAGAARHCAPDAPGAWAEAMLELDQAPTRTAEMATAGTARAAAFNWQKTAKTVLELAKALPVT
jgi:glycosyltransferase involved in cell wall biosynthesis